MSDRFPNSRKKYSARSLAAGSVFCPACRKLTERDAKMCPNCGFAGEQTMHLFPVRAPALERISDHAKLFSKHEQNSLSRSIASLERQFPQIRWKIVTADLGENENLGLFGFWLLNVSPPGSGEELSERPWTILLLILANGDIAVVPGYAAEVWLSGHEWTRLLRVFQKSLRKTANYARASQEFLNQTRRMFFMSWQRVKKNVRKSRNKDLTELK